MCETINVKADKEQNITEDNEKIKTQGFARGFASNTATINDPKKSIFYRSYTDKQTADFISPIIEMVLVKDATLVAGIILLLPIIFEKCGMKTKKFLRRRKGIVLKRIC